MNWPAFQYDSPGQAPALRLQRMCRRVLHPLARKTIIGVDPIPVPLPHQDGAPICRAKPASRFDQRVEYCLEIEGRAADDLEHVSSRRLLLQRFAQLVEQPRVFDGDYGLGGEVLHQFDLFVTERAHFLAKHRYDTDRLAFLEHWYGKDRSVVSELHRGYRQRVAFEIRLFLCDVRVLHRLPRLCRTGKGDVSTWADRSSAEQVSERRRDVVQRSHVEGVPFAQH